MLSDCDILPYNNPAYFGQLTLNRIPYIQEAWSDCDLVINLGEDILVFVVPLDWQDSLQSRLLVIADLKYVERFVLEEAKDAVKQTAASPSGSLCL